MSSSSSTTVAKKKFAEPDALCKTINASFLSICFVLTVLAIFSVFKPKFLENIGNPGKKVEARGFVEYADKELRTGNFNNAIRLYTRALSVDSTSLSAKINICVAYAQCKNFDLAIGLLKSYIKPNYPPLAVIYFNIAEIYNSIQQPDSAYFYYLKASESGYFPIYSYRMLGKIALEKGHFEIAKSKFQLALDNALNIKNSYTGMLKKSIYDCDDTSLAFKTISDQLNEKNIIPDLGKTYDSLIFLEVLSTEKDISRLYDCLGVCYNRTGSNDSAYICFAKALEIWPQNQSARNNLQFVSMSNKKIF
jgi:tetratricopeptide (TPR) repeat protein